jgi:predicted GNAT family N-acyltransferase
MGSFTLHSVAWHEAQAALMAIRYQVFIEEQQVPVAEEWDQWDADAIHFLVTTTPEQIPIATARLLLSGHIGRVAVLAAWRRQGVGKVLLQTVVEYAQQRQMPHLFLNAQVSALGFYQQAGFIAVPGVFMDAGIPHQRMWWQTVPT